MPTLNIINKAQNTDHRNNLKHGYVVNAINLKSLHIKKKHNIMLVPNHILVVKYVNGASNNYAKLGGLEFYWMSLNRANKAVELLVTKRRC